MVRQTDESVFPVSFDYAVLLSKGTVLLCVSIVQTPRHEWEERKVWITSGYKARQVLK